MTKWILAAMLAAIASGAQAQYYGTGSNSQSHSVQGYIRNNSNGTSTYVQPSYATNPNNTQMDNYSTRGNYNPYTGSYGTRRPRY